MIDLEVFDFNNFIWCYFIIIIILILLVCICGTWYQLNKVLKRAGYENTVICLLLMFLTHT